MVSDRLSYRTNKLYHRERLEATKKGSECEKDMFLCKTGKRNSINAFYLLVKKISLSRYSKEKLKSLKNPNSANNIIANIQRDCSHIKNYNL